MIILLFLLLLLNKYMNKYKQINKHIYIYIYIDSSTHNTERFSSSPSSPGIEPWSRSLPLLAI